MGAIVSGSPPLSPDQIAKLRDDSIAMQLVLTGAFDDRITELKQIQADITVKQEALISLDQANSVRADADTYAATIAKQCTDLFDRANKALKDADNRADQVAAQQAAIDASLADLKQQQADFATQSLNDATALQQDRDKAMASIKAGNDALAQRESALAQAQAILVDAQAQLAKDQAAVADLKSQLQSKLDAFAKL